MTTDPRITEAKRLIVELAALLPAGGSDPRVEATLSALAALEAEAVQRRLDDARIAEISEALFALGALKFDQPVRLLHDGSALDALGVTVNMLGEELGGYIEEVRRADESLRKSETQLRQAQKMEAVGRLAGGVAHDFNNLLSIILSYSALVLDALPSGDPIRAEMVEIQRAGERAARLTKQLLTFSRHQVLAPTRVDVNELLTNLARMIGRLVGEDIDLKTVTSAISPCVFGDAGQLEQVVVNLVVNARDAMPNGGALTIECSNVELEAAQATAHLSVKPGPYVLIAVSDTGVGMDEAIQSRLFEPFFTTKPVGKGSGLGLSLVFGIVRQHGGTIWVYSEPGKGTTFKIYLPRVGEAGVVKPAARESPKNYTGHETILLVEDDEQLRNLAMTVLTRKGYRVLPARNGVDALVVSEGFAEAIDLLLTDVVMPQLAGGELARRLSPLRPEMKVIFMSGYTDDAVVRQGVLHAGVPFLQKPITPTALARKVREVLDSGERVPDFI